MPVLAHIQETLHKLADLCDLTDLGDQQGWHASVWRMSNEAILSLIELYQQAIEIDLAEPVVEVLEADGVDLPALLRDEEAAQDLITRSDLTELAAAASLVSAEDASPELMELANVPKGRRSHSRSGIDVAVALIDTSKSGPEMGSEERVILCSVKHTLQDGQRMVSDLVASLSEETLSAPYVASQLRVLHGRLQERGIQADRIFEALAEFPDPQRVVLIGVGAADDPQTQPFLDALSSLPEVDADSRRIGCIHLPGLATLHEHV